MINQEWINALVGGGIIGFAATLLLIANGRVTGVSGIFFGVIKPIKNDTLWRVQFLLGLLIGSAASSVFVPNAMTNTLNRPMLLIILAGLLVGFGSRLGGGCTSGHGVCGISRLSSRSIVATLVFMASGAITVAATSYFAGGF